MGWMAERQMLENEGAQEWAMYTDNDDYFGLYAIMNAKAVKRSLLKFFDERDRRGATESPMSEDEEKQAARLALCGSKKELARVQEVIDEVNAPPPAPPAGGRFERLPRGFFSIVGWVQQMFEPDEKNVMSDATHRFSVTCTQCDEKSFTLAHGWCSPLTKLVLHIEHHDIGTPEVPDWSEIHSKQIVPSNAQLRKYYREHCRMTKSKPDWDVPQEEGAKEVVDGQRGKRNRDGEDEVSDDSEDDDLTVSDADEEDDEYDDDDSLSLDEEEADAILALMLDEEEEEEDEEEDW